MFRVFIFLLMTFSVVYGDEIPEKWKTCTTDNDCTKFICGCSSEQIVMNKEFSGNLDCPGATACNAMPEPSPKIACVNHTCINVWKACSDNKNCTAAGVRCQGWINTAWYPTNTHYYSEVKNALQNENCNKSWTNTGPSPEAKCINTQCQL